MGVQKPSAKVGKKSVKGDALKNLVFGNSATKKPAASNSKAGSASKVASAQKKASAATPKTQVSKANANTKTGGKTKVNSSVVQNGLKNASAAEIASKLAANVSKRLGSSGSIRLDIMGETVCREVACEGLATSGGYCRLHYIKNWKKIKRKELILRERKLNQYIEELVAKYPDKYIEAIRQDLASDKDFAKVIYDLDLDEGMDDFDIEGGESVDSLIDTIKRDFDDEGDAY